MADLSKIKLNGTTYDLKDAAAREALEAMPNITIFESDKHFPNGFFEDNAEYTPGLYNENTETYDYYTYGEIYDAIENGVTILYLKDILNDRWNINRAYIAEAIGSNINFINYTANDYFSFIYNENNRNNNAVLTYHWEPEPDNIIYIDLVQGEEGFETEEGYTYAELKALVDTANINKQIVCLRYNKQLWYLTNSNQLDEVLVGTAVVGTDILSE